MKEGIVASLYLISLKSTLDLTCSSKDLGIQIPRFMDTFFAVNFGYTIFGLVYLRFFSREYLFELKNTT